MSIENRIFNGIVNVIILAAVMYGLWLLMRVCMFDYFTIPSYSMYPTLKPGDKVLVNKLLMGARIYKSFDFSTKGQELMTESVLLLIIICVRELSHYQVTV